VAAWDVRCTIIPIVLIGVGRILVSSIKNLVGYENHQTGFERMREKFLRLSLERETTEC
jgi:hypothetical protein